MNKNAAPRAKGSLSGTPRNWLEEPPRKAGGRRQKTIFWLRERRELSRPLEKNTAEKSKNGSNVVL